LLWRLSRLYRLGRLLRRRLLLRLLGWRLSCRLVA
jgi:hypothetical protein